MSRFFTYYAMLILAPILFVGWKLVKRTRLVAPHKADLVGDQPVIDAYDASLANAPVGFWAKMVQLVGLRRRPGGNDLRKSDVAP